MLRRTRHFICCQQAAAYNNSSSDVTTTTILNLHHHQTQKENTTSNFLSSLHQQLDEKHSSSSSSDNIIDDENHKQKQKEDRKNTDLVKTSFQRLLAQPHYGQCPLRKYAIQQAIKEISGGAPAASTSSPSSSLNNNETTSSNQKKNNTIHHPLNVPDLVLDSARDGVDKKYPHLGAGLRRIALEALDSSLKNYTCTTPLGGPIPHDEIESHITRIEEFAKFLNPNWIVVPIGRHRRGAPASRSIDVLITDPTMTSASSSSRSRSNHNNFSNINNTRTQDQIHQDAPFVVLSKMKKAMEASGYALHCQQQRGKGIATLAGLVQHEPFDEKFIADRDRYLSRKTLVTRTDALARKLKKASAEKGEGEGNSADRSPIFSLLSPKSSSSSKSSMMSLQQQQHQRNNNNNNSSTSSTTNIAQGIVPQEHISLKSESLMTKILRLHQRQQARVLRERKEEEEEKIKNKNHQQSVTADENKDNDNNNNTTSSEKNNNNNINDDDTPLDEEELDVCMELALEECPPPKQRTVSLPTTSSGVLRDIGNSDKDDDDDEDSSSRSTTNSSSSSFVIKNSKEESTTTSFLKSLEEDADNDESEEDEEDDDGIRSDSLHSKRMKAEQEHGEGEGRKDEEGNNNDARSNTCKADHKPQTTSSSSSSSFNKNLNKLEEKGVKKSKTKGAKSYSMSYNAGIVVTEHFPLIPRQVPRRINLVWAPYERFYALKLLLTGPKEFSSYLIDRAPRFGYKLTEDGVFTSISSEEHADDLKSSLCEESGIKKEAGDGKFGSSSVKSCAFQTKLNQDVEREQREEEASRGGMTSSGNTNNNNKRKKFRITPRSKSEIAIHSESELLARLRMGYIAPMDR